MAKVDPARLQRYRNEMTGNSHSYIKVPYFKLVSPVTKVRILPGQEPGSLEKDYYVTMFLHYNASPISKFPVTCPKSKGQSQYCPICDHVKELKRSSSEQDQKLANDLKPNIRYAMGIIPREGESAGQYFVYQAPKTIWSKVQALFGDDDYGDVTDPYEGFDIKFMKTGSGQNNTNYDALPVRNPSPLAPTQKEIDVLLANQFDLWRMREAPDPEEIKLYMAGDITFFTTGGLSIPKADQSVTDEEEEDTVEEEEDEAPPPPKKKLPAPVVEEEDDEPVPTKLPAKPSRLSNLDAVRAKLGR